MSKISIAMTTYNGGRFLREQLDSIARQSRLPDELVACDDRSTDNSIEILEAFRAEVPFPVKVVPNEVNLGYARNFEQAIGLCEGDLIFSCDQDDVWHPTKLEKHEAIYRDQPDVGMVFNNARYIDADSKLLDGTIFEVAFGRNPRLVEWMETDRAFTVLARTWRVYGCMMSFRARFWSQVTPIPERLGHDDWLAICLSMLSRIRLISEPLNDYRRHANQVIAGGSANTGPPGSYVPMFARLTQQRATELSRIKVRLETLGGAETSLRFPSHQDYLEGLIGHLRRRASMSEKLTRRMPLILAELLLNNYARYNDNLKDCLSEDVRQDRYR